MTETQTKSEQTRKRVGEKNRKLSQLCAFANQFISKLHNENKTYRISIPQVLTDLQVCLKSRPFLGNVSSIHFRRHF